MKIVGMIPVRLESSRLPEKALKDICGLPLIIHTMLRTQRAKRLDEVYVVTDSDVICDLVGQYGGKFIKTSSDHNTGSDRIAEAATKIEADVIVNIQGDEALVYPEHIDMGVEALVDSDCQVSILLTKYRKRNSPSDIKAVVNLNNEIMYFSRNDIPSESRKSIDHIYKAYHIVSFRKDFLLQYASMEQTPLERVEFNEYLRILENGYKIKGTFVESDCISVDTQEDLDYVRGVMQNDELFKEYIIDNV
ncbi:MAG: 3-deoxy-manno-octulosonate cytidylyltransferase [Bacteroidales bacterium]|jgi:3-deoxy-manno-octulosonate cytidylyltransferase (CMP-KDO synthetase)|nr:3-deoxy-manno-octulosonate cytidylyltransferase [Bacteroidales bacterium]